MTKAKVNIAIPTDDGMIIGPQFKGSRAFLVITIRECKIIRQELRWNLLSEMMTSEHGYFYNLCDCDVVIVSNVGKGHTELLKARNITIVKTTLSLIPEILFTYLQSTSAAIELK